MQRREPIVPPDVDVSSFFYEQLDNVQMIIPRGVVQNGDLVTVQLVEDLLHFRRADAGQEALHGLEIAFAGEL